MDGLGEEVLHQLRLVHMPSHGFVAVAVDEHQAELGSRIHGFDRFERPGLDVHGVLPFAGDHKRSIDQWFWYMRKYSSTTRFVCK